MEVIEFNLALIFVMKFISSITKDFSKLTLSKCIKTNYPISNKVSCIQIVPRIFAGF